MRILLPRHIMTVGLMVLVLLHCSGCAVVESTATRVQTIQLPPGKLCSRDFYRTATPEMVKKEIGDKSLADEYYIRKDLGRNSHGGTNSIGGGIMGIVTAPFISQSYVDKTFIDPLVAASSSPYPEVIVLLLEAGAGRYGEAQEPGHIRAQLNSYLRMHSKEESFFLLRPYLLDDPCERLFDFHRGWSVDSSKFDIYLSSYPETDLNCRRKGGATPLQDFTSNYSSGGGVQWLLQNGANTEQPFSNGKTPLSNNVERSHGHEGVLLQYGAKMAPLTEKEREILQKYLMKRLYRYNGISGDEERYEKFFAKMIHDDDQKRSKIIGELCTLREGAGAARLREMFDKGGI